MKFIDLVKIDDFSKSIRIGRSLYVVYYYSSNLKNHSNVETLQQIPIPYPVPMFFLWHTTNELLLFKGYFVDLIFWPMNSLIPIAKLEEIIVSLYIVCTSLFLRIYGNYLWVCNCMNLKTWLFLLLFSPLLKKGGNKKTKVAKSVFTFFYRQKRSLPKNCVQVFNCTTLCIPYTWVNISSRWDASTAGGRDTSDICPSCWRAGEELWIGWTDIEIPG